MYEDKYVPVETDEAKANAPIQHGIDNDPTHDTQKGAVLGGVGGAVAGGIAGSVLGPAGAALGAAVGGVVGAAGSAAAVNAVDRVDNDNNVTGVGEHVSRRDGVQTGGHDIDGYPDTRGISEKTADAITGDRIDDKTGMPVD